jgi:hypothetical protein
MRQPPSEPLKMQRRIASSASLAASADLTAARCTATQDRSPGDATQPSARETDVFARHPVCAKLLADLGQERETEARANSCSLAMTMRTFNYLNES